MEWFNDAGCALWRIILMIQRSCVHVMQFRTGLWSIWNISNLNMYLKYTICNLYFVFCCFLNVFSISIIFFTVICIWNTSWAGQVLHIDRFRFPFAWEPWFLSHVKCLLSTDTSLGRSISLFLCVGAYVWWIYFCHSTTYPPCLGRVASRLKVICI